MEDVFLRDIFNINMILWYYRKKYFFSITYMINKKIIKKYLLKIHFYYKFNFIKLWNISLEKTTLV